MFENVYKGKMEKGPKKLILACLFQPSKFYFTAI